jgi:hypothetical protein
VDQGVEELGQCANADEACTRYCDGSHPSSDGILFREARLGSPLYFLN